MSFDVWSISIILIKFLIYIFTLYSVGTFLFNAITKPEPHLVLKRFHIFATIFAIATSILFIPLNVGMFNDDGLAGIWDIEIAVIIIDSPIGTSTFVRILGLTILLISCLIPNNSKQLVGWSAAIITCWSFTQIGHISNIDPSIVKILLVAHLLAAAFWIGAFMPIYRAASGLIPHTQTAEISHKFGQIAVYTISILFFVGLAMAFLLVGHPIQLFLSEYGLTLLFKILVFGITLGFAALNKLRLVPAINQNQPNALGHLKKTIAMEVILIAAILLTTAILTTALTLPEHH